MIGILSRIFIKFRENYKSPSVRTAYGILCGIVGIFFNVLLFAFKYYAGVISGSISVSADAFNNLSDAASSAVSFLGFRLAAQKPHSGHPFGHGRFEYVSGLIISILIITMSFEIGKTSLNKILDPQPTQLSPVIFIILTASILIKLYMFLYNRIYGKRIDSSAMKATAFDSLSDAASTSAVLISSLISYRFGLNIDGYCGLLVSLFILYTGISSARDTLNPLIGLPPSPDFVRDVEDIVRSHPPVIGVHDLIVHDYGPGRRMISLHAEVPGSMSAFGIHDVIDHIELELQTRLGCSAVIHMDPVDTEDPLLAEISSDLTRIIAGIDPRLSFHDLRIISGVSYTNVIFDLSVPDSVKLSDARLNSIIQSELRKQRGGSFVCTVKTDRSFIG